MVEHGIRAKLPVFAAALMLWLMLASIMGASASCFDTERASASFTAFVSTRWIQTTRDDFALDARSNVDIDCLPGNVVLNGRTEFLYAFRGSNTNTFWRYNTSAGTWNTLANAPGSLRDDGSALSSDGDRYIYAIEGGNRQFWRYDTQSNSWATMARTPSAVRLGGGLTFDGRNNFYTLQGASNTGFWGYNVTTNTWRVLARTPASVSDGGCLVHDQGNYIYALRGNGQNAFWRYNTTSNTWSTMASVPYQVRYGGAMTYDGIDSIYAMPGWSQSYFLRYSISENRWYSMANLPSTVYLGGSLSFSYPGYIYAFSGATTTRFWRYQISANSWSAATSAPGTVRAGGALASGYMLNARSGTLTSVVVDTTDVGTTVQGLFWTEGLRAGTDITFEMRASDTLVSGAPNGPWINLGGTSPVTSGLPSGRYLQWRATLTTTNNHLTPVLREVRAYYA